MKKRITRMITVLLALVIVASICMVGAAAQSFTFNNFGTSAQGSTAFTSTTTVKGIHSHNHTVLSVYNGKNVSTGKITMYKGNSTGGSPIGRADYNLYSYITYPQQVRINNTSGSVGTYDKGTYFDYYKNSSGGFSSNLTVQIY